MRIGVIGGGRVGSALAERWRAAGHDVRVSTRGTIPETAAGSGVVLLAVPAPVVKEALAAAGPLAGTILVDATNNLSGGPSTAEIAALVPQAHVVKAFNTVFAQYYGGAPPDPPPSMVYCGDDREAKAGAARLIADAGFEPVDAGELDRAPDLEAFARLVIGIAYRQGRGPFVYRFQAK